MQQAIKTIVGKYRSNCPLFFVAHSNIFLYSSQSRCIFIVTELIVSLALLLQLVIICTRHYIKLFVVRLSRFFFFLEESLPWLRVAKRQISQRLCTELIYSYLLVQTCPGFYLGLKLPIILIEADVQRKRYTSQQSPLLRGPRDQKKLRKQTWK